MCLDKINKIPAHIAPYSNVRAQAFLVQIRSDQISNHFMKDIREEMEWKSILKQIILKVVIIYFGQVCVN